jgi:hypothetical protein
MNHGLAANGAKLRARTHLAALFCCAVVGMLLPARSPAANSDRINLFPKLSAGQTLFYRITYHGDKNTKTQSSLVVAQVPPPVKVEVRALLRLEVLGVETQGQRAVVHARTRFESIEADDQAQTRDATKNVVEFTILSNGRIDQVTGLDVLSPYQQQAWQQWSSRFATAGVFPQNGIRVAQKWRTDESEKSPSPLARLRWTRESTYVGDEPCRPLRMNDQGDFVDSDQPPESCAVILTTATLKQESSPKDATPDDYRIRQLRTSGTARGSNRTITYISLKTGLVVRASDDADQAMSVTIAKADASNRVHYDVTAKSNAAVLLVENAPPNKP